MVEETTQELVQTSLTNQTASLDVRKNCLAMETICENINRILSPANESSQASKAQQPPDPPSTDQQSKDNIVAAPEAQSSPQAQHDSSKPVVSASELGSKEDSATELKPDEEIRKTTEKTGTVTDQVKETSSGGSPCNVVVPPPEDPCPPQAVKKRSGSDVVVEERNNDPPAGNNGSTDKSKEGVIVLDD